MDIEDVEQKRRRGRPAGRMTSRRWQVFQAYSATIDAGERLSWSRLARECGLYDYREARRIVRDLERLRIIWS